MAVLCRLCGWRFLAMICQLMVSSEQLVFSLIFPLVPGVGQNQGPWMLFAMRRPALIVMCFFGFNLPVVWMGTPWCLGSGDGVQARLGYFPLSFVASFALASRVWA